MMSSIVMMPRMTFRRFTTGMTFRSYLETISETSSWSVSGRTERTLSFMISSKLTSSAEAKISRKSADPIS